MRNEWSDRAADDPKQDRRALRWILILSVLIGAALIFGWAQAAFARPTVVPAGRTFTCTPTRIWDGDGPVWCAEGPRLRLRGIATRERDDSCRRGHPCPRATGEAATRHLAKLLGTPAGRSRDGHLLVHGRRFACRSYGADRYGRTLADMRSAEGDVGERMIRDGFAARWSYLPPER